MGGEPPVCWARGLLQFFWPPVCPLCGQQEPRAGEIFCRTCARGMTPAGEPWCPLCCLPYSGIGPSHPCPRCLRDPPPFVGTRVWGVYQGALAAAIHQFKYTGRLYVRKALQDLAVATFRALPAGETFDSVVPVPSHPRSLRRRGTDLPALLSRAVSRFSGTPWHCRALRRSGNTPDLVGLSAPERARVVRDAFVPRAPLRGSVLLVDDVVTTTATSRVCAAACRRAGAERVWVLALARTPEKLHG